MTAQASSGGQGPMAMRLEAAALVAQEVTKTYRTRTIRGARSEVVRVDALRGVSLEIHKGEVLAIVGESGSGKSTLGRHLLGMEKPDTGAVTFGGKDIQTLTRAERHVFRRAIQVVFQDPSSSLNPRMRVGAILAEPLSAIRAIPRKQFSERIEDTLSRVDLPTDAQFRYPHQFSVGQRQRIAIARAIAVRPSIIIMDEPVSSLDVSVAARVLDLIVHLRDELGMGLLLISHNLAHVKKIAQNVAVMRSGEVVERGLVRDVFSHPQHAYTQKLLEAVPRIRYERQAGVPSVHGDGSDA